jgi:transposase
VGAGCPNWARPDLCGGRAVTRVPTAINASGLDGLSDQPRRNGPLPRLSTEQQAAVAAWVDQGADLERDGVVRWRRVDLQQRIQQSFGVGLHERTVGKLLRKLSFRRLSVRPQHPQSDPVAQASFRLSFLLS